MTMEMAAPKPKLPWRNAVGVGVDPHQFQKALSGTLSPMM